MACLHRDLATKQKLIDELYDENQALKLDMTELTEASNRAREEFASWQRHHETIRAADVQTNNELIKLRCDLATANRKILELTQENTEFKTAAHADKARLTKLVVAFKDMQREIQNKDRKLAATAAIESLDARTVGDTEWENKLKEIESISSLEDMRQVLREYHRKIRVYSERLKSYNDRVIQTRQSYEEAKKTIGTLTTDSSVEA
eukprot:jgi/Hompol1/5167/HPOL_004218-RA